MSAKAINKLLNKSMKHIKYYQVHKQKNNMTKVETHLNQNKLTPANTKIHIGSIPTSNMKTIISLNKEKEERNSLSKSSDSTYVASMKK